MTTKPTAATSALTAVIAGLLEDHAHIAATRPADALVQAAALRAAGEDVAILARAVEVMLREAENK